MANKHVVNPCSLSNKALPEGTDALYWSDPVTGTVRVFCPRCSNYVSVNKVNKTLRKHTMKEIAVSPDQTGFVQSFE